jgi:capsular polysaccharide biosynthesis protein
MTEEAAPTEGVVVESVEHERKEETLAESVKDAVLDIKADVRDIQDQNDLSNRVAEKVLRGLTQWMQAQTAASSEEAEPQPEPEVAPETTEPEQDVAPRRSHRLFRKVGRKDE